MAKLFNMQHESDMQPAYLFKIGQCLEINLACTKLMTKKYYLNECFFWHIGWLQQHKKRREKKIGAEVGHLAIRPCSTIHLDHGWSSPLAPFSCTLLSSHVSLNVQRSIDLYLTLIDSQQPSEIRSSKDPPASRGFP